MLDKVQPFTARPTMEQANALVAQINKARQKIVDAALIAAADNGQCSVVEETLRGIGLGDCLPVTEYDVTIKVRVSLEPENVREGRPSDADLEDCAIEEVRYNGGQAAFVSAEPVQ